MTRSDDSRVEIPNEELISLLRPLLEDRGIRSDGMTLIERTSNPEASRAPSEIVTIGVGDSPPLRLLCKHEADPRPGRFGHWQGVSYEASVYRHVLQSLQVSVPRSYGTFLEPARGAPILVLEYLEPDEPGASLTLLEAEVVLAASWLASFHARAEDRIADEALRFLQVFDHGFYAGWIERTEQYARRLPHRLPWLPELCRRSLGLMERLGQTPLTVIHGEFYRKNILVRSSTVYPIDWDSAARGAAEVDLAALTEGWPEATRDEAEARYVRVRWPAGEPADFRSRLDAARLYFHYRWLGESRNAPAKRHWRMEQLRLTAERMGI